MAERMAAGSDPEAGASAAGTAPAPDGTPLFLRHWPAAGKPWAVLLLVHGLAEHSGRYERTGRLLAAAGLDVHAFDLRGHGRSGGREVFVNRWQDFLDDLASRAGAVRRPDLPFVLMGHSMGATIVLGYLASPNLPADAPKPDYLVLSAPAIEADIPATQRTLAPVLSLLTPMRIIENPISPEQLARDPEVGKAYFADPLVRPRSTARLGAEFIAAMAALQKDLRVPVPALVVHGGEDRLVPTESSEVLATLPLVERRVIPGLRHEILNEPEGPQVVAVITGWLRNKTTASAMAARKAAETGGREGST